MITLSEAQHFAARCNPEEARAVGDALKERYSLRQESAAAAFRVEQVVHFFDKRGVAVVGQITKVNRKTIKVLAVATDDNAFRTNWTVSPSLLHLGSPS